MDMVQMMVSQPSQCSVSSAWDLSRSIDRDRFDDGPRIGMARGLKRNLKAPPNRAELEVVNKVFKFKAYSRGAAEDMASSKAFHSIDIAMMMMLMMTSITD